MSEQIQPQLKSNWTFIDNLVSEIELKARFHKNTGNDPHDVSTAVYIALSEVAQAIRDVQVLEKINTPTPVARLDGEI